MNSNTVNIYDRLLEKKLPICVLDIIDEYIFKSDFKPTYTGLEFYRHGIYNDIQIKKKEKKELLENIRSLINNPYVEMMFKEDCRLVYYFKGRCLCKYCGNVCIK